VATAVKQQSARAAADVSRRAQRHQQRRAKARRRLIGAIAAVVLVGAVVAVVAVSKRGGSAAQPAFAGTTINVDLSEYMIAGNLTAPAGEVRLHAVNRGVLPHNVGVRGGPITNNIAPGKTATLDLGNLRQGTYHLYCDVDDHAQRGMVSTLIITAPVPTSAPTTAAAG